MNKIKVQWPNGLKTYELEGNSLITAANLAGIKIPLGCNSGRCGTCEISIDGRTVRACKSYFRVNNSFEIKVELIEDEYW